jgi:7-carboxy-7-deazaguanine synthase
MTSSVVDRTGAPGQRAGGATVPVIEIFGPTIQGEGPDAGRPAYFVRFGGCDFRCSWCDSMYAVDPAEVRANAELLDTDTILARIGELAGGPNLVVLSGGNPALLELGALVVALRERDFEIAVETQGSRWKPWLAQVDRLVVSPKGPSSGMDHADHRQALGDFMRHAEVAGAEPTLKAVIFDEADLEHARWLARCWPTRRLHLSTGTDVGLDEDETIGRLRRRLRWLSEAVAQDPVLRRAQVGTQQHVLTWGTRRGV